MPRTFCEIQTLEGRRLFAAGDGLVGTYFSDANLTQLAAMRTDSVVSFNWGTAAPSGIAGMGSDGFSVRWTGKVQSIASGVYTFSVKSDDGVRLWVNGKLIIDDWTARSTVTERRASMALLGAATQYDLKLEYFDNDGPSQVALSWQGPSISKQVVPTSVLFTATAPTPTPTPTPTTPVASLALVNSSTESTIAGYETIYNGGTVDLDSALASTPYVNLRADLASGVTNVGSMKFVLDGVTVVDNAVPYATLGETTTGGYKRWTPGLGLHTLVATKYSGANATGTAGSSQTFTFTVIDSTPDADPYPNSPQPSPGGTRYVVNRYGAIPTVSEAASLARPGDVVLILPGVYNEFVALPTGGTAARRITYAAAENGTAVIDGTGHAQIFDAAIDYITLQGIVFDHASNTVQQPAVQIGSYAVMTDCTVQNTDGQGLIVYGTGAVLTRVISQYNGEEGLTGVTCSNVLVKDCITRYNNNGKVNPVWAGTEHAIFANGLWYVDATWQAGGGKWVQTDGVTLDGLQSYGNTGPGIWFDYLNTNVIVRNCNSHDNGSITPQRFYESFGINIELCDGPVLVENNTVGQHGYASIVVQSSRKVTVRNNTVTGSPILLLDWPRGSNYTLQDISVTNNILSSSFIWADGGTWTTSSGTSKRLTIDYNTYQTNSGKVLFRLVSTDYTKLSTIRSTLGFETHGSQTTGSLATAAPTRTGTRTVPAATPARITKAAATPTASPVAAPAVSVASLSPVAVEDEVATVKPPIVRPITVLGGGLSNRFRRF